MYLPSVLFHVALWCAGARVSSSVSTIARAADIQDSIRHNDYCPSRVCPQDSQHFICEYTSLQPEHLQAQCAQYRRINLNYTHVNEILRIANDVRSSCAMGRCRGVALNFKQQRMPKGYGIIRLRWDSELAGLAQVMADRCVKFYDLKHCVAARKFRDPREVHFLIHERVVETKKPVDRSAEELLKEFQQKIEHAQHNTRVHYILNVPDLNVQLSNWDTRFITMVYYKATHIGCGAAQYNDPDGSYPESDGLNYVDSHSYLRCFMSHSPELGKPAYDLKPQRGMCGCDPDVPEEPKTCLCISNKEPTFEQFSKPTTTTSSTTPTTKPTTKPTAEPFAEPISESTTEPITESTTEPITESTSVTTFSTKPVFVEPSYPNKRIRGPTEPTTEPGPK